MFSGNYGLSDDAWSVVLNQLTIQDLARVDQVSQDFSLWARKNGAYKKMRLEKQRILEKFLEQILLEHLSSKLHVLIDDIAGVADYRKSKQDYQALKDFAQMHDSLDLLPAWAASFSNAFKLLFLLPPNTLNQAHIDLIAKISMFSGDFDLADNNIANFNLLFKSNYNQTKDCYSLAKSIMVILIIAAEINEDYFFNLLLERQPELAKLRFAKRYGASLLHEAIVSSQYGKAKQLVKLGADVNLATADILSAPIELPEYSALSLPYTSPLFDLLFSVLALTTEKGNNDKIREAIDFVRFLIQAGANPAQLCYNPITDRIDDSPLLSATVINEHVNDLPFPEYKDLIKELCYCIIEPPDQTNKLNV